jgi:aspartyl-tRNA(Asn)/glutamyl-tRNA(Gln) amidotransferase subunit B
MPAGYQITQYRRPIAEHGHLKYWVYNSRQAASPAYHKCTRIARVQLENDSAKTIQDNANRRTLIDLNRAGGILISVHYVYLRCRCRTYGNHH